MNKQALFTMLENKTMLDDEPHYSLSVNTLDKYKKLLDDNFLYSSLENKCISKLKDNITHGLIRSRLDLKYSYYKILLKLVMVEVLIHMQDDTVVMDLPLDITFK